MGMFQQMKDMNDMINAAPAMVAQAQQLSARAREMPAAQQAALQAQAAQSGGAANGAATAGLDFEPIDGVSLEQFAAVSKGVAAYNYDQSMLPQVAASKGIAPNAWDAAAQGWNERIRRNRGVAQRFNQVYRGI